MIIPPMTTKVKRFSPTLADFLAAITFRQPAVIPLSAQQEPIRLVFKEPESEAKVMTEIVGERAVGEAIDATTDHAWLVVLGLCVGAPVYVWLFGCVAWCTLLLMVGPRLARGVVLWASW